MKFCLVQPLLVAFALLFAPTGWATGWTQYKISNGVIGGGGTRLADGNYHHLSTVGQPLISVIENVPYRNEAGFWYQPGYVITSVFQNEDRLPQRHQLDQNYPNPFNPTTTIRFALPKQSHVTLRIYDVLGREVSTVIDEVLKGGVHHVTLDAQHFASGVYFYRMTTKGFVQTRKLIVLK